ncbi:hypothetical protein J1605_010908 [Eschrichtius robustus]|uniref:TRAF3-interacting protein 1 C-terminal domain-containing protein n=1 Tax=Eschrichtius robustus TaxID=9764 RepID=A0AB34GT64_ESCRO|nr:hypothetical protein J1605_010908 [Eschrichtius robustus]
MPTRAPGPITSAPASAGQPSSTSPAAPALPLAAPSVRTPYLPLSTKRSCSPRLEKLLVFESAWKKEKDIVSKEIEKLRGSIQSLCRSALPLGKIMDYLQEDVDAMQKELQLWRSESRQHAEALQAERSITDCAMEPLKAELAELEQLVRDQQDKICAVKASILKNEEKIQKMVHSINLSSRR